MKRVERSARREYRASVLLLAGTVTALVLFGLLLWAAIMSIDGARGLYKTSPDAPESLASLGAPRSQLELDRTFSSMKREYTEDGMKVCEPIAREYRASFDGEGEHSALSVEEILYIISDSSELYDTYDVVRLVSSDGGVEQEIKPIGDLAHEGVPYHVAAQKRTEDVLRIITYRIFALSSPDAMTRTEEGYTYTPEYTEREGVRSFTISDSIVFHADNGRAVRLYPTDKTVEACNSTVLLESKRALGRAEREVIAASGYDADVSRNVTPEYMYGRTGLRLAAVRGRVIVVDVDGYVAVDVLPRDEKLLSVALEGEYLYITSSRADGSALWRYKSGGEAELVYESDESFLGVYVDGNTVGLYAAKRLESKKYITLIVRTGEPMITVEK